MQNIDSNGLINEHMRLDSKFSSTVHTLCYRCLRWEVRIIPGETKEVVKYFVCQFNPEAIQANSLIHCSVKLIYSPHVEQTAVFFSWGTWNPTFYYNTPTRASLPHAIIFQIIAHVIIIGELRKPSWLFMLCSCLLLCKRCSYNSCASFYYPTIYSVW